MNGRGGRGDARGQRACPHTRLPAHLARQPQRQGVTHCHAVVQGVVHHKVLQPR